jgi:GTPase Era involved in 16S rRNA processing
MCKEMPVIPVNRVEDKKIIIGKNGGQRRRRGTRVVDPPQIKPALLCNVLPT